MTLVQSIRITKLPDDSLRGFLALAIMVLLAVPGEAKTAEIDSPFPVAAQSQMQRAGRYLKSGKFGQASPILLSVLQSSDSLAQCLAIAAFTEPYGFPVLEVRRECMRKALSLSSTREDLMQVIVQARQYQLYEITKQAITSLVKTASTPEELYKLAQQAHEVALNDVCHMALQRILDGVKSVPEALKFAQDAQSLGMEDLSYKTAKELIDDEDNAHQLCALLRSIEPLGLKDLNRYCLKKALDKALTVEEFVEIYEAARRYHESDILQVAAYRGRKLKVINKIKQDQAEYQRQYQIWRESAQQDMSKAKNEPEEASPAGF